MKLQCIKWTASSLYKPFGVVKKIKAHNFYLASLGKILFFLICENNLLDKNLLLCF